MTAITYTLECACFDGIGYTSEPWSAYHYSVRALAEKLAQRLGADRGDFCVVAHGEPVAPEQAAALADCWAHVALWQEVNGLDDIPF
jgi:hypothetical protein